MNNEKECTAQSGKETKAWADEGEAHLFLWLIKKLGSLPIQGEKHQHINPTDFKSQNAYSKIVEYRFPFFIPIGHTILK